jgi:tRNA/tmRNA/rRNA uracil-C5-methylase (TrmA/RlmC/RlmD family)
VHPGAAQLLADAVLDALEPKPGDIALDLHCGVGLFAGVLAERVGENGGSSATRAWSRPRSSR